MKDEYLCEWIDVIEQLEEPYKSVFIEKILWGLGYADIAKRHGKTESWARVTYHRAKPKIKELIR